MSESDSSVAVVDLARHAGQSAAARLRLPFRNQSWRGAVGSWMGSATGSSIDFQDHRPYFLGDDVRYIDWMAYARSGHYTMKLFHEEVSPHADLVLDCSASMRSDQGKFLRVMELFFFCIESAVRSGALLRIHGISGGLLMNWPLEQVLKPGWTFPCDQKGGGSAPDLARVPFRASSMRILISDLLFPGLPRPFLQRLSSAKGRSLLFVPYMEEEVEPGWDGNIEFEDVETGELRLKRMLEGDVARYREDYRRHFSLWHEESRRLRVLYQRISCSESLVRQAGRLVAAGVVEPCR